MKKLQALFIAALIALVLMINNAMARGPWHRDLTIGTDTLDQSLLFQVESGTKAAKFAPSMSTAARDAISSTAIGAGVWNTTTSFRNDYNGSSWIEQLYSTTTQEVTNKSIDANNNTITNIDNNEIKASAGIERSKIAAGTADYVVINGGAGLLSEEQFLSKVRGGAGADMSSVEFPSSGSLAVKNAAQTFTEEQTLAKSLVFTELSSTPSTPSTGLKKVYCRSDDKCYQLNDAGSEVELGAAAGGGGLLESNTMADGGFESGVADLTQTTGSCATSTTGVRDGFGDQLAQCSLSAQAANISYVYTDANVTAGDQGYVKCWVRSSITDLEFCSLNGNAEHDCKTYVGGPGGIDTWEEMALSVPLSGTNDGFKLKTTATTTDTFELDNCYAGVIPTGVINESAIVGNWESYTPTFGGLGTPTSIQMYWRRVGDSMEIRGRFNTGTVTASEAQIGLPNSEVIDSAKLSSTLPVGRVSRDNATNPGIKNFTALATGGDTFINIGIAHQDAAGSPFTPQNGASLFGGTEAASIYARVPIQGWSGTRRSIGGSVDRFIVQAEGNVGTSITSNATDVDFTETYDLGNHWDGDSYTASKTGKYCAVGSVALTTNSDLAVSSFIDGTIDKRWARQGGSINTHNFVGCTTLNKGESLSIRINDNVTLSNNTEQHHITIWYQPDNEQILAGLSNVLTDAEIAQFTISSGNLISGADAVHYIDFGTQVIDDDGNVLGEGTGVTTTNGSGWRYVVPVAGRYEVNFSCNFNGALNPADNERVRSHVYQGATQRCSDHYEFTDANTDQDAIGRLNGCILDAAQSDTIQVGVQQNTGDNISTKTGSNCYVSVKRLD